MMRFPDFFICGAAKSGTTSLWQYLQQHPSIYLPPEIENKEPGYFSSLRPLNDIHSYLSLFENADKSQVTGEASGAYLTSPDSAKWISTAVPDAKIIIMLRNPADRAYSLYKWMTAAGYEFITTFEEALEIESKNRINNERFKSNNPEYYYNYLYFHSGLYSNQVKRYLDYFPRNQLHFIIFEEFLENTPEEVNKVYRFLGVEDRLEPGIKVYNKGVGVRSVKLQFVLKQYVAKLPILNKIKFSQFLMKLNTTNDRGLPNEELKGKLLEKYTADIYRTEQLVNLDLSGYWLKK